MTSRFLTVSVAGALLSGCVHMSSISTTSVPMDRSTPVYAEANKFMFLWVNFSNDYVDFLTEDLAAQCPNGRVEGILTKQEDIVYFPIGGAVRVSASGFCVNAPANAMPAGPAPAPVVPVEEETAAPEAEPAPDASEDVPSEEATP